MRVLGLITEYNPFHNGHLYHLNKSKKLTGATHTIAVMSGNYIQRGEPAVVDKWARAKMALSCGVDLVLELPVIYAVQSAEIFAYGAIKILDSTRIVDAICFGSEIGNINPLTDVARILADEPNEFKDIIKKYISTGLSYPSAREKAITEYMNLNGNSYLSSPNNVLGIEYIKNLIRLNSKIVPYTIKRISAEYNEIGIKNGISSATAIRHAINNGKLNELKSVMPLSCIDIMLKEFSDGKGPITIKSFEQLILYKLMSMDESDLKEIQDINEGLENRIKKYTLQEWDIDQILMHVKTKRYTLTRLKRIFLHTLLDLKKKDLMEFNRHGGPKYIRILGFNDKGKELIRIMKKSASLPVITNVRNIRKYPILIKKMLDIESFSTNVYTLGFNNTAKRKAGLDAVNHPVYVS